MYIQIHRAGAQARDLRPARQAADRHGQRPADDRPDRAAVDVVAPGAVLRHVAAAAVRPLARVCSAPQRRTATIARARANEPHPGRAGTSRRCSRPCSSTATSRPRSSSPRLHSLVCGDSVELMRSTCMHAHARNHIRHDRASAGARGVCMRNYKARTRSKTMSAPGMLGDGLGGKDGPPRFVGVLVLHSGWLSGSPPPVACGLK
jgi:hypothetical protein